jgi:hypothetical protein
MRLTEYWRLKSRRYTLGGLRQNQTDANAPTNTRESEVYNFENARRENTPASRPAEVVEARS